MRRATRGAVAVLALVWAGAGAQAQNLLTNPDFDTDLGGWTAVSGGTWSYLAGGWPTGVFTPGSAKAVNDITLAGGTMLLSQCVAVQPSTTYVQSFQGFIPTGQGSTGSLGLTVRRFTNGTCSGAASDTATNPSVTTGSTAWQHSSAAVTTGPGELSAEVAVRVYKAQSGGSFEARVDALYFGKPAKGDLDRDGRVDLLLDDLATEGHTAWFMARERQAGAAALSPAADGPDWKLSAVDDFDPGSASSAALRDDLVFRNTATGELQFWLMNGTSRTSLAPLTGAPPPPVEWQLTASADFNQDGQADLLWRNDTTQKLMAWTMNGTAYTGTLTPNPDQAVNANWGCVGALDVDKDGSTDLLWYNASTGKIVIWYLDASLVRTTGKFAEPPNAGNNNWKVLAAGNYAQVASPAADSVDLVWRNQTSGKLVLWYMNTSFVKVGGGFTSPDSPSPALGWTVAGPR